MFFGWRSELETGSSAVRFKHKVISLLRSEEFSPGHRIVAQGSQVRNIYFIRKGDVLIEHQNKHGEIFQVAILSSGSFFGEYQTLTMTKSFFTLRVPKT